MNKFFNYYTSLCAGVNTPSIFSTDPFIISIKQMFLNELQQIVYYIEKLKDLNIDMSEYTDKVIEFISVIINNMDFQKENFFVIIEDLYNNKLLLEKLYISSCEKMDISPDLLNAYKQDLSSKDNILKALNEYEKNLQLSKSELNKNKKTLYEIIINLVLNACNCLIELKNYGVNSKDAKNKVLKLLNSSNFPSVTEEDLIFTIKKFSKSNYMIMKLLNETIIDNFGPIIEKEVSICKKKGKAILVSGYSFLELEKLLIAVKDLDINIYTHNGMINAFQYEKFEKYSNLVSYYQKSDNNFALDFASFPGPIYISRNSVPKIDVIRGQIYTSAKYPSFGIGKIENDNFSSVIQYALNSEGFIDDEYITKINIGYNIEKINENILKLIEKFNNNDFKSVVIVGLLDKFDITNEYIKEFLELCPDDIFIISFSYFIDRKNFWYVNSYYDFSILYKIIEILIMKVPDIKNKINIVLTNCNKSTISHIFNLIHLGITKIFLGPCCPNVINPLLYDGLIDIFNINKITDVKNDIEKIL